MTAAAAFRRALQKYGRAVRLNAADGPETRAWIAPFTHQNRQYLDERYSAIGWRDQNAFLYLGSPEGAGGRLAAGDVLFDCGARYVAAVCEPVRVGGTPVYMWGILRHAGEEEIV